MKSWEWPTDEQIDAYHRKRRAEKRAIEMRQARIDLACAALTGIVAGDVSVPDGAMALRAVALADETLARLYPDDEAKP